MYNNAMHKTGIVTLCYRGVYKKVNKLLWLGGHIVVFVVCDIDLLSACNNI